MLEIPTTCATCGKPHSGATPALSGPCPPGFTPGDIALCVECQAINVVGDDLRLRKPTASELAEIDRDVVLGILRAGLARTKAHEARFN